MLGSALGLLCHQRGIAPLHCSAVDVPDGCVAFVGDSGAGKSTLIAALAKHGHSVICDDVCLLRLGANDTVHAWPGISRIRLWEDARSALGYDDPGIERELYGYNKYLVPVRPPRNPLQSRRLRRVYQLHAASDDVSKVTSLKGAAALEAIMRNVYRLGFAECLGYKPQVFKFSAAAARDVPVFQFSRPLGFNCLGKSIELLENHLRDIC